MGHRLLQKYLDGIIKTPIPPDVFAREQKWELIYVQRTAKKLDKEGECYRAEQYAAAAQQFGNVTRTISEIAQETPITIKGILDGKIPSLLDPLNRRNAALVNGLAYTIGLAAIEAYLDQNRTAVNELISIFPQEEATAYFGKTDQEKKDDVKWKLRNLLEEEGWDEEIQEQLQSATDSGEESPPMPSGSSRQK